MNTSWFNPKRLQPHQVSCFLWSVLQSALEALSSAHGAAAVGRLCPHWQLAADSPGALPARPPRSPFPAGSVSDTQQCSSSPSPVHRIEG